MKQPTTQVQATLWFLIRNTSVTSIELRNLTNSSYPAARIQNLKDIGLRIDSRPHKHSKHCTIARYMLLTPKKEAISIYQKLTA
jgi:hypothetical protein